MANNEQETQTLTDSFEAFDREVLNIRRAWELWRLMTGSVIQGPDVKILYDAAPTFYWYASQSLLAAVVLGVSRLADPMEDSRGRENLTLERIYKETEDAHRIKSNVRADHAMNKALEKIGSDDFRNVRNKVLAHNDLATILGKDASLDVEAIRHAVEWIARFHSRIKAVRDGTGINLATGEGAFPAPDDVEVCRDEITSLIDRLAT